MDNINGIYIVLTFYVIQYSC